MINVRRSAPKRYDVPPSPITAYCAMQRDCAVTAPTEVACPCFNAEEIQYTTNLHLDNVDNQIGLEICSSDI